MTDLDDQYEPQNPTHRAAKGWNAALVAESGPQEGTHWRIDKPVFVIGAADDCDLAIANSHLAKYHAYIFLRDHVVSLRHLGPAPVITVNGRMMRWGELQDGDLLMLGSTQVRVELKSMAAGVPSDLPWAMNDTADGKPPFVRNVFPA